LPDEGHGVFTYYLIEALRGAAAADDGQIRLGSVATYLQEQVTAWGQRARREQTPRLDLAAGDDFALLVAPPRPKQPAPTPDPPPRQPRARQFDRRIDPSRR